MANGNKKSRGKKKNKPRQQQKKNNAERTANTPESRKSASPGGSTSTPAPLNATELKETWQDLSSFISSTANSEFDKNYKSVYTRYKEATSRFVQALRGKVPKDLFPSESANCLIGAVDYLADSDIVVENEMMRDLKFSLVTRRRVADSYGDASDSGHQHFITILTYCWAILRAKHKKQKSAPARNNKAQQVHKDPLVNMFQNLMTDEHALDEPDSLLDNLVPKVNSKPVVPLRLTLKELIHGTDRMAVISYIMTLDELMGYNADQYSKLKESYCRGKQEGYPPLTIVEQVMETAAASNLSIQMVASLEQQFAHDFPHMNTIYRVFSVLVFPELAKTLTDIVTEHSSVASKFKEKHAYEFIGDSIECTVRSKSDPLNRSADLANEFADTWKVPLEKVEKLFTGVRYATEVECPLKQELASVSRVVQKSSGLLKPHAWLVMFPFLGGDRSITSTVRLLQGIGAYFHTTPGSFMLTQGYFGKQWTDYKKVNKIAMGLDEFLMGDVMPLLYTMCTMGLFSAELPFERELLTLFTELKSFIKHPLQSVSWSLVFAVHTLLTSVFEVQGEVYRIGEEVKTSFRCFVDQIDWCLGLASVDKPKPQIWYPNLLTLHKLQYLASPIFSRQETADRMRQQERHALWNPLCGGSLMLYLSYFGNLEAGLGMVDSFAQLRMVLHLYNALLQVGLMPERIELLDWLHDTFQSSKAIWEGPLPTSGEFVQRWWVVFGTKVEQARRRSEETKKSILSPHEAQHTSTSTDLPKMGSETRRMAPITPKEMSKSFRRICLHDFSDVEDRYHTPQQRLMAGDTDFYRHAVRSNDTLDAMEDDQRLLAYNLCSLGEILDQFIVKLFEVLELTPLVSTLLAEFPEHLRTDRRADGRRASRWETSEGNLERLTMVGLFAEKILGPMDFHPRPYEIKTVVRSAASMILFFKQVEPSTLMYFQPTQFVD